MAKTVIYRCFQENSDNFLRRKKQICYNENFSDDLGEEASNEK